MSAPINMSADKFYKMSKVTERLLRCLLRERNSWVQRSLSVVASQKEHKETNWEVKEEKDSLSVLKALASTVKKDPSTPQYTFVDDPYFLPFGLGSMKLYTLCKLAGKNAARYVIDKHPYIFVNKSAEPYIKAFDPKKIDYIHNDPTEEALLERIEMRRVSDSVDIYKILKESEENISQETYLKLLDLLCVYNGKDPERIIEPAEFWVTDRKSRYSLHDEKWKKNGIAEEVFDNLPEKTVRAYNSLLRGMVQYNEFESAWDLYCEMKDKNIQVSLVCYNELIRNVRFAPALMNEKWKCVKDILNDMNTANVQPDLETFNAVFRVILNFRRHRGKSNFAMSTLSEMKALDIEPSLSTWGSIVSIMYTDEDHKSRIIYSIMNEIENKEFSLHHPDDGNFFMIIISKNYLFLQDLDLAYRIENMLNVGNNRDLMDCVDTVTIYYSRFFSLVCMFETMDKIIEWYETYIPHTWSPNITGFTDILKAIELHGERGCEFLPRIWSDMVRARYCNNETLNELVFHLMAKEKQSKPLSDAYLSIVQDALNRWTKKTGLRTEYDFKLTGNMIGDMVEICCNSGDVTQAWNVLELYLNDELRIPKIPREESLMCLMDVSLKEKNVAKAIKCLEAMSHLCIGQIGELTLKIKSELELTEEEERKIDSIV